MHLYYERQGGKGLRFYWLGWREVIPELERMRWQVLLLLTCALRALETSNKKMR